MKQHSTKITYINVNCTKTNHQKGELKSQCKTAEDNTSLAC